MDNKILARLVQIGKVTAMRAEDNTVRVKFEDTGITSDWLHVLQRSNNVTVLSGGEKEHTHDVRLGQWMPAINDIVVVIFLPIFNSDGFVIGGV